MFNGLVKRSWDIFDRIKFVLASIVEFKRFPGSLKRQVPCIVHRIAALQLHALSRCFYACMCMYTDMLLRASKGPYHSRIFGTRSMPASERTSERASRKTVLRRLFSISISLRMESPDWEVSLMLFESWHASGYDSVI